MTEASANTRSVVIEREFPHSQEKLWRALTQPHLIQEWLMNNNFALVVGHRFELKGDWGGVLECEVLEIEPTRILSYTWNFDNPDPAFGLQSIVTFTLTPTKSGTHLRMQQSGFRPDQKQAFGGAKSGWEQFFAKLHHLLQQVD